MGRQYTFQQQLLRTAGKALPGTRKEKRRSYLMKHVSLGGLDVSRIGLGAMTMAGTYTSGGSLDDAESIRAIHRALDLGVTHIDTAEVYGPFHSEELVGQAIKGRRDQVVVATKFGLVSHSGGGPGVTDSSAANVRAAVEGSLKRLGTDYIDLYYQHRVDPNTPIEETASALAELVTEGKVCTPGDIPDDDWRKTNPRFTGENFQRNLAIVDEVAAAADGIQLSDGQLDRLSNLTPAVGERHDEANMASIDR
jgi:aryl-alcohol dehydrogenase-like predicted oxidoreductase